MVIGLVENAVNLVVSSEMDVSFANETDDFHLAGVKPSSAWSLILRSLCTPQLMSWLTISWRIPTLAHDSRRLKPSHTLMRW